jgi:hypothetical protein
MASTLSLNNIVPVTLQVTATPQAAKNFNIGLVMAASVATKPTAWGAIQRTAPYTSAAAIGTDFGTGGGTGGNDTALQNFANAYFSQSPAPASLKVGLWLNSDANITAALTSAFNYDPNFYLVACEPGTTAANVKSAAAFCAANGLRFFFNTQEADCLIPGSTAGNLLSYLSGAAGVAGATSTPRACGIYTDAASDVNNVGAAAVMAIAATMNLGAPNSMKTFMFQSLASLSASTLTQAQLTGITGTFDGVTPGWNGNVYATFGNTAMLARGQACDGRFEDEGIALDWLSSNIQVAAFNAMQQAATSGSRIPQTDSGSAMLVNAFTTVMEQAKAAGLCAPGIWTFQGVGNVNTLDVLPRGYYIYAAPVSSLTTAQRAARQAPPISILVCGAGAIQYCAPTIVFQR